MTKLFTIISLMALTLVVSCTKGAKTPEGLVKLYIEKMTSNKISKSFFEEFSTGELKEKVAAMSSDDFDKYKNVANIESVKVKILSTNCRDNTCSVKYIVSYDVYTETKKSFSTDVKKLAKVVKEGETWKLADITNLKTFHDSKESISIGL